MPTAVSVRRLSKTSWTPSYTSTMNTGYRAGHRSSCSVGLGSSCSFSSNFPLPDADRMLKQGYLSLTHVVEENVVEENVVEEKVVEETSRHVSKQNVLDVIKSQVQLAQIAVQI